MIRISRWAAIAVTLLTIQLVAQVQPVRAECTEATFAQAVDKIGATLRSYNSEAQPQMRQRLTALAEKKGWTGEDREERAMLYLEDGRLGELDTRANELLSKVDQLGRPDKNGKFDCSKLSEIEATSIELLAIMKTKALTWRTRWRARSGRRSPLSPRRRRQAVRRQPPPRSSRRHPKHRLPQSRPSHGQPRPFRLNPKLPFPSQPLRRIPTVSGTARPRPSCRRRGRSERHGRRHSACCAGQRSPSPSTGHLRCGGPGIHDR